MPDKRVVSTQLSDITALVQAGVAGSETGLTGNEVIAAAGLVVGAVTGAGAGPS